MLRALASFIGACVVYGQAAETSGTNPPIRDISPGLYQVGLVRLDAKKRIIEFPATVNMREGPVEYLVVSAIGKLHESIFKTEAEPYHIHTAALLLLPAAGTNRTGKVEVEIQVGEKSVRAAELVLDVEKNAPMQHPVWQYNGSRVVDGTFLAQRDGSIVALIGDRDALLDSPGPDRDKDENWRPRASELPLLGTAVTVKLKFIEEKK